MMKHITLATMAISASVAEATRLGTSLAEERVDVDVGLPIMFEPRVFEQRERRVAVEVEAAERKEYAFDESTTVFEGTRIYGAADEEGQRELRIRSCPSGKGIFEFILGTDLYGYETSWTLETQAGTYLVGGPPPGTRYQDLTVYTGSACLAVGPHVLEISDQYGDGVCCSYGDGNYAIKINGDFVHRMPTNGQAFHNISLAFNVTEFVATTTTAPTAAPPTTTPQPTARPACYNVNITMQVDNWGMETAWVLMNMNGTNETVMQDGNVPNNGMSFQNACLLPGDYEFVITDGAHDGICCAYGRGHFEIFVQGSRVFWGGRFPDELRQVIKVGFDHAATMNDRDRDWLDAHNTRRKDWHGRWMVPYAPLKHSTRLAEHALAWAEALQDDCWNERDLWHEPNVTMGENLAGNKGTGSWGRLYSADSITNRWVDFEETWSWPANAHLTQALWVPSLYMGCGESVRVYNGTKICRRQVCRYIKAGNCAMNEFPDESQRLSSVYQPDSQCGETCPPEGCYA